MRIQQKVISLFFVANLIFLQFINPASAQGPTNFPNCRLGVGGAFSPYVGDYNMAQLNMGLYLDWWTTNDPYSDLGLPANVEYFHTVRVHQAKADYGSGWYGPPRVYLDPPAYKVSPGLTQIANTAANQPGSLWLIGNEIERVDWPEGSSWGGQDEITPELYATAFHEIREVIKTADPTARIAIGGIIQPTQLRLDYLDRVWNSYQAQYGYSMGEDIDVWNIHLFIIREVLNDWGAEIPAGFDNNDGDPTNNYNPADAFLGNANYQTVLDAHHDINYYRQFVEDFRAWMAAKGERDKPLLDTEFGILMDLNNTQVINFLEATFDYMFAATDTATGYPRDENRLLQGWVWYSLNDNVSYFQEGTLFNSSKNLTAVGNAWKDYVTDPANPLASQPQYNLLVTDLRADPNPAPTFPGGTTAVTLQVDIANSGNTKTSTNNSIVVKFWDGDPNQSGSNLIGSQTLNDIPGCGRFTTAEVVWPNRPIGDYTWYAQVMPIATETNSGDNLASSEFSVIEGLPEPDSFLVYLPLILK